MHMRLIRARNSGLQRVVPLSMSLMRGPVRSIRRRSARGGTTIHATRNSTAPARAVPQPAPHTALATVSAPWPARVRSRRRRRCRRIPRRTQVHLQFPIRVSWRRSRERRYHAIKGVRHRIRRQNVREAREITESILHGCIRTRFVCIMYQWSKDLRLLHSTLTHPHSTYVHDRHPIPYMSRIAWQLHLFFRFSILVCTKDQSSCRARRSPCFFQQRIIENMHG